MTWLVACVLLVVACAGDAAEEAMSEDHPQASEAEATDSITVFEAYYRTLPPDDSAHDDTGPDLLFWARFTENAELTPILAKADLDILLPPRSGRLGGRATEDQISRARYTLARATRPLGPPEVSEILNRVLVARGQPVYAVSAPSANSSWGEAVCRGKRQVVLLALKPQQRLSDYTMLFIREHEIAHHELGHVNCAIGKTRRSGGPQEEHDADCAAARALLHFRAGSRVLDRSWANFSYLRIGRTPTHPSTQARADTIESPHCWP